MGQRLEKRRECQRSDRYRANIDRNRLQRFRLEETASIIHPQDDEGREQKRAGDIPSHQVIQIVENCSQARNPRC
jgi:hypothetical protein